MEPMLCYSSSKHLYCAPAAARFTSKQTLNKTSLLPLPAANALAPPDQLHGAGITYIAKLKRTLTPVLPLPSP